MSVIKVYDFTVLNAELLKAMHQYIVKIKNILLPVYLDKEMCK